MVATPRLFLLNLTSSCPLLLAPPWSGPRCVNWQFFLFSFPFRSRVPWSFRNFFLHSSRELFKSMGCFLSTEARRVSSVPVIGREAADASQQASRKNRRPRLLFLSVESSRTVFFFSCVVPLISEGDTCFLFFHQGRATRPSAWLAFPSCGTEGPALPSSFLSFVLYSPGLEILVLHGEICEEHRFFPCVKL